jgi:hypothetical protein
MYELKNIWKVFTSKFVGTGPSSYKKIIYQAAVSHRLRNTAVQDTLNNTLKENMLSISGEGNIQHGPSFMCYFTNLAQWM